MKKKTFGDTALEPIYLYENELGTQQSIFNTDKYQKNGLDFLEPSDIISSRDLNRPARQLFEEIDGGYDIIQTLSKIILGDKQTGVIPDILEEYNADKMAIGYFNNEPYLRIPTGALLLNLRSRNETTSIINDLNPIFTETEGEDFNLSNYVNRDHNSVIVHTKPNIELYEREVAQSASFDLNEQNNNIDINYTIDNNHNLTYTCNITRTAFDHNDNEILTTNKSLTKASGSYNNIFDLTPDILNHLNAYSDPNGYYSLEELIPLKSFMPTSGSAKTYKFVVFYRIDDNFIDNSVFSLSGNFGIKKVSNFTDNISGGKILKMFNVNLTFTPSTKKVTFKDLATDAPSGKKLLINKINRSSLDIKNLTVSNNYITVGNKTNGMTAWHLCEDTDVSSMV